jgi:Zn-dependent protease
MLKALLILLSAGKLGAVLKTSLTMLISIAAYLPLYGWRYAVGFVLLIFVHEMGHYLAARQRGLKVGAPTFIPFVGAWVDLKDKPHDVAVEAYVAIAGPVTGTLGALACYYAGLHFESRLLLALSYSGFMINLFNLLPLPPLDGGRITAALSPRIWLLGGPMLAALFLWRPSPLLLIVGLFALPQLRAALRYDPKAPGSAYYAITMEQRLLYGLLYGLLVVFLAMKAYDVSLVLGQ